MKITVDLPASSTYWLNASQLEHMSPLNLHEAALVVILALRSHLGSIPLHKKDLHPTTHERSASPELSACLSISLLTPSKASCSQPDCIQKYDMDLHFGSKQVPDVNALLDEHVDLRHHIWTGRFNNAYRTSDPIHNTMAHS